MINVVEASSILDLDAYKTIAFNECIKCTKSMSSVLSLASKRNKCYAEAVSANKVVSIDTEPDLYDIKNNNVDQTVIVNVPKELYLVTFLESLFIGPTALVTNELALNNNEPTTNTLTHALQCISNIEAVCKSKEPEPLFFMPETFINRFSTRYNKRFKFFSILGQDVKQCLTAIADVKFINVFIDLAYCENRTEVTEFIKSTPLFQRVYLAD